MARKRNSRQTSDSRLLRAARGIVRLRLVRTGLLILLCLALGVTLNLESLQELVQAQGERDQELAAKVEMERLLSTMRERRRALALDSNAIERAAREEHRMTRPGEVLVLIEREGANH